jgi:hypothetical protein
MTQRQLFWTTTDPYNAVADWQTWLDSNAGNQGKDWGWYQWAVVAGDSDERTVISIWFIDYTTAVLFKLTHDCEYYFGENNIDTEGYHRI